MKRILRTSSGEELVVGVDIDATNAAKMLMRHKATEVRAEVAVASSTEKVQRHSRKATRKAR